MSENTQSDAALAQLLEARLVAWDKAREPQERRMLECYQDVMRIARDDDTKGSGAAKAGKTSGLFIGSTRNKVRASRAKINDALFGNGKMPFDTTPSDPQLEQFSKVMEKILTEQLERMGAKQMLKSGVDTLATFGTGFLFGPFVRKECHIQTKADNSMGYTAIKEDKYEYDSPYYLLGNTLDVYPDSEARNVADGLGTFWVTMESRHTVTAWKGDKQYSNVDAALLKGTDNTTETGSERAAQARANIEYWHKGDRVKVARFFGKIPKHMVGSTEENQADAESSEMIDAIVVMAGGVVVKCVKAPYTADNPPVLPCQYEDVPHEMWGVGVADNNSPHQKVVNAAFRLFMEGKGMALLGTRSVDRSKFMPGEDFKKSPGKVYLMKPGLTAEERQTAIINHLEEDVSSGWREVIEVSEQFSDDDTAVNKYTQGNDASNLNKTASGISMIMSAGSMPTKEVIQNIDENWIEPLIEGLIVWNIKYLEPETVTRLHGEEAGRLWMQIKQFGKTSFMKWQATGTSSFMAKEVLLNKIRGYLELCLSNPDLAAKVDIAELLEQYWDCMEIGKESPIIKPEGAKVPPQVQQQMDEMKQHTQMLEQSLQEIGEKYNELHAETAAKDEDRLIKAYEAATKRLALIAEYMTPAMVQQLADNIGLDVANDADLSQIFAMKQVQAAAEIAPPETEAPQETPPEPELPAPEQPADDAGFFVPGEQDAGAPEETQL